MFTGIVETLGTVKSLKKDQKNILLSIETPFTEELRIDQSIAHNGVCLTVTGINGNVYAATVIRETLDKTNLGSLKTGDLINLERSLIAGGRFDGHIVQGHIDQTGTCLSVTETGGSWLYTFEYDTSKGNITVEKGSICVNGVSLTVVNSRNNQFSVAIIPYTYEHTNFHRIQKEAIVNLEFDILGKYIARLIKKDDNGSLKDFTGNLSDSF